MSTFISGLLIFIAVTLAVFLISYLILDYVTDGYKLDDKDIEGED